MKILVIIVRTLLGLAFVATGVNIFVPFIPAPPQEPGPATEFGKILFASHYFYAIGALQLVGGALLLIARFVPLGLTLLGPVIVNILLFHIFLERKGLPIAFVVSALALFLLWAYRKAFAGLVKNSPPAV
jgi:putative oxidoreductase